MSIFIFAKYNAKTNKITKMLSEFCFGAYLVHIMLWEELILKLKWSTLAFNPIFSVPVFSVVVFLISIIISGVLNQIPAVKKYIV